MIRHTFLTQFSGFSISIALFFIMLILFYLGVRVRQYLFAKYPGNADKNFGSIEGALLGLLALLLSFTFSMSSIRYDNRLKIIVEEANDIGTAILRADLYPDSIRAAFRHDFKAYVESRIEFFETGVDTGRIYSSLATSGRIQRSLWNRATTLGRDKDNLHRTAQMIPALNAMIDIVSTRNAANLAKVPEIIIYLLFLLCCTTAFMIGYAAGKRPDWIVTVGFALMITMTIYLIIDLDRPRRGIITMKNTQEQIVQLRNMFSEGE